MPSGAKAAVIYGGGVISSAVASAFAPSAKGRRGR